jgi:FtsP/CotA-like multicopper oxidase with cupredoxin domain
MNYDVVMDPWLVSDWYHENPFSLFYVDLGPNAPPKVMSTLLQGQGRFCSDAPANSNCTGSYWETTFIQNTTYKLSIVNAGTQSQQTFWIDGHSFWVVSTDFVPIEPFWADTLNIAIGEPS